MARRRYHLGIDIGGTFTDLSVLDRQTGHQLGLKTPTIPANLARGVAKGIGLLAELGIPPEEIDYFVHGTTIGVNAIIQRTGAPIALLVTEGFRDVLELARLRLPTPWDFYGQRPAPLIPRERVVPVRERIRHGGTVETILTDAEIERVVTYVQSLAVEGIAICLLHAYANPAHELALKDALTDRGPDLFVSCSAEIWPQMREYERALVTVMNAYVRPPLVRYLTTLETTLRELGVAARPYLTRSNGGIMTTTAAKSHPVQTLLSGPASGVIGAAAVAREAGYPNAITFDMGGTSADIAIVTDGHVDDSREAHVGDFPLILPVVGVSSIGAGGGSLAWIDGAGVLKVGPRSAGADPGPACYGLGGEGATLTDAFLVSGYLNPFRFSGKAHLDETAARDALTNIAQPLQRSVPETASAMIRVAIANMYAEFSAVLERRGLDPRDFTLVAFGGAGPVVACQLAAEVNMQRVLVPPSPGTLCALGALHADVMSDFVRTLHWRLDQSAGPALARTIAELRSVGLAWLAQEAPAVSETMLRWSVDMRYVGQSYEIEIAAAESWLVAAAPSALATAFHAAHQRVFNHADLTAPIEAINVRVRAIGQMGDRPVTESAAVRSGEPEPVATRLIDVAGSLHDAGVYHRESLGAGHHLTGPAVIEQADATTVIPADWAAIVDDHGNLVIERGAIR